MVPPQSSTARYRDSDGYNLVPPDISNAAARYQRFREIEAEHLARMARHDLLVEWSAEARQTVMTARECIHDARDARDAFRLQVRDFVRALQSSHEAMSGTLRHTRTMLRLLEHAGAVREDGGELEAEVMEWVIQEFSDD